MAYKVMTFPCAFEGGRSQSISFYIGYPASDSHPISFQMKWLGAKGGNVPPNISTALLNLKNLSLKYNVPFVELCDYVIANINK